MQNPINLQNLSNSDSVGRGNHGGIDPRSPMQACIVSLVHAVNTPGQGQNIQGGSKRDILSLQLLQMMTQESFKAVVI